MCNCIGLVFYTGCDDSITSIVMLLHHCLNGKTQPTEKNQQNNKKVMSAKIGRLN